MQVYDASLYVNQAIDLVQTNILIGSGDHRPAAFLRSIGSIIGLSIPISVIAVAVLTAMGRTVNLISLAGFAFSVGMVVDNSIVVIEHIPTPRMGSVYGEPPGTALLKSPVRFADPDDARRLPTRASSKKPLTIP